MWKASVVKHLLADKVHDGDVLLVVADADVHWEMGIHELHLVLVALPASSNACCLREQ